MAAIWFDLVTYVQSLVCGLRRRSAILKAQRHEILKGIVQNDGVKDANVLVGPTLLVAYPFVQLFQNVEPFGNFSENGVLAIQVIKAGVQRDHELKTSKQDINSIAVVRKR